MTPTLSLGLRMEPCKRVNLYAQRHHMPSRVPRRIEVKLVFLFDLGTKQQICPGKRTGKVTYRDGLQFQKQTRNAKRPSDQTVSVGRKLRSRLKRTTRPAASAPRPPLLSTSRPSATCSPSECCNPTTSSRPPTAFRRKSTSADQEGSLPCPGSWT